MIPFYSLRIRVIAFLLPFTLIFGNFSPIESIAVGGNLIAWGNNSDGQTNVPSNLSNVIAIASANNHNLALQADGMVRVWGINGLANVPADFSNVVAIASGAQHGLALQANGMVRAWGYNYFGQPTFRQI